MTKEVFMTARELVEWQSVPRAPKWAYYSTLYAADQGNCRQVGRTLAEFMEQYSWELTDQGWQTLTREDAKPRRVSVSHGLEYVYGRGWLSNWTSCKRSTVPFFSFGQRWHQERKGTNRFGLAIFFA